MESGSTNRDRRKVSFTHTINEEHSAHSTVAISGAPVTVVKRGGPPSQGTILCFGIFISMTTAALWSAQSSLHFNCFVSAPAFSTMWVYFAMCFHLVPLVVRGRKYRLEAEKPAFWFLRCIPLQTSPKTYFGLSCLTVSSYYFIIRACKYTTLTSISLLDALAIPAAMVTSSLLLERKYRFLHIAGATICVLGVLFDALGDFVGEEAGKELLYGSIARKQGVLGGYQTDVDIDRKLQYETTEYPNKLTGDLFAILGGILGGVADVFTEKTVRHNGGSQEYLAMVGLFSFFLSGLLTLSLEVNEVNAWYFQGAATCPLRNSVLMMLVFIVALLVKFETSYNFLLVSEAALLNLILLTSDVFSGIFEIVEEGMYPMPLFWMGLFMVLLGIFIYEQDTSPLESTGDNASNTSSRTDGGDIQDFYRPETPTHNNTTLPFDIQFQNYP